MLSSVPLLTCNTWNQGVLNVYAPNNHAKNSKVPKLDTFWITIFQGNQIDIGLLQCPLDHHIPILPYLLEIRCVQCPLIFDLHIFHSSFMLKPSYISHQESWKSTSSVTHCKGILALTSSSFHLSTIPKAPQEYLFLHGAHIDMGTSRKCLHVESALVFFHLEKQYISGV